MILLTDSAKSYKLKLPGVLHDKVVHGKKRVKVKGDMAVATPPLCADRHPQVARY